MERPPFMRRKHQDRIITAAARLYEWGRLVLSPNEIVYVQPREWMPRRELEPRKSETKPQRATRIAA